MTLFLFGKVEQYFFHAGFFRALSKICIEIGCLLFLVDRVVEYFINGIHQCLPLGNHVPGYVSLFV